MELYRRITADINASVTGNTATLLRIKSELHQQITNVERIYATSVKWIGYYT